MSETEWDVEAFIRGLRRGEFDGRLTETLHNLTPDQLRELEVYLIEEPL
jgi:hypothetical protein